MNEITIVNGKSSILDRGKLSKSKENSLGEILKVKDLLQNGRLKIPIYQRPYKWTVKHIGQLMDDIILHSDKSAYRLGTIVIHEEENSEVWNIVDGQQRTITLVLIAKAILELKTIEFKNQDLKALIEKLSTTLIDPGFNHEISINNIRVNYQEISRRVLGLDEKTIYFLFFKCEFVRFVLTDISEAFQFFDSQNARGRDLEPHDLLKAYHLREFSVLDEDLKEQVVEGWESMKTKDLTKLFGEHLFRIKGWSKGISSRYFSKDDVALFKGINLDKIENYPYTEMLRIAHVFVDRYNDSYERKIDLNKSSYPFQIDHTIINGRRFFEMVTHYTQVFDKLLKSIKEEEITNPMAIRIFKTLDTYEGRERTGDRYIKGLFDCALIYYVDKFGTKELSKAVEKIFIWAYSIRLQQQAVQLATVDNYVLEENFFKIIREANSPLDALKIYLKPIENNRSTKTNDLVEIFKELRYYAK